jgi:hypothetical protein
LKNKQYSDFKLTRGEWDRIKLVHEVLAVWHYLSILYSISHFQQECAKATQTYSSIKYPTLSQTIPNLEYMINTFQAMADTDRFKPVAQSLQKALNNAEKWYNKIDQSDAYFIVLGAQSTLFVYPFI